MMEKRMLKKVSTVTAAGIMMTAMLGMQVSAAESSDSEAAVKKNPTITKQITKESNIYAPKTTFKFTVAPGTAVPASENQEAIYAGPANGVTLDKDVIASVPADSDIGNEKITVGTTKLNVNESVFTKGKNAKPGIFRYVVSEVSMPSSSFPERFRSIRTISGFSAMATEIAVSLFLQLEHNSKRGSFESVHSSR